MNTEHGQLTIVEQVQVRYETEAENAMAKKYGMKWFEAVGNCRKCLCDINPVFGCKYCEVDQMCEAHARSRYTCRHPDCVD